MMKSKLREYSGWLIAMAILATGIVFGQYAPPGGGGGAPSGNAGGDLSGTYPNPGVAQVNGAAVPLSAGFLGTDGSRHLVSVAAPTGATPQFVQTNTVTVTGVTAATTMAGTGTGSLTLPANFFSGAGSVLNVDWAGMWNGANSATLDGLTIKLGATVIASGNVATAGTGNGACSLHLTMTARTVGVSGTVLLMSPGAICLSPTGGTLFAFALGTVTTPVTINTTTSQVFDIQITPGATAKTYTSTNLVLRGY